MYKHIYPVIVHSILSYSNNTQVHIFMFARYRSCSVCIADWKIKSSASIYLFTTICWIHVNVQKSRVLKTVVSEHGSVTIEEADFSVADCMCLSQCQSQRANAWTHYLQHVFVFFSLFKTVVFLIDLYFYSLYFGHYRHITLFTQYLRSKFYHMPVIRARAPKVRGPIVIVLVIIIRARAPKVRGPIVIVLVIIRARAPKVRGPIVIVLVIIIIIFFPTKEGAFWGL